MGELVYRKCSICKESKELSFKNFPKRKLKNAPPFRRECKDCYNENKRNNPLYWAHRMLSGARRRALIKNIEFNLDAQDIWDAWPQDLKCPILKIELITGRVNLYNSPSLDRIDNNKGYVKGNVIIVCSRANCIKNDGTWQEIMAVGEFYKQLEEKKDAN